VTTSRDPDREEPVDDPTPTNADSLLQAVCRSVTSLLAAAPAPPRRVSVRAGTIAVELEWPDTAVTALEQPVSVPSSAAPEAARPAASAPEPIGREGENGFFYIRASTVGTFYRAPEPGARPFVAEGDEVRPGQQLGILEAMKMMLPVAADRAGRVAEFLVENATPVEFDAPLIALTALEPIP